MNTLNDFTNKYVKNKKLVLELTKIPPKIKQREQAHFFVPNKNAILMMDVVFMPEDKRNKNNTQTFKYILVAMDVCTNNIDAIEMGNKESNTILKTFQLMMRRTKYLDKKINYVQIITDSGKEFKGEFDKYIRDKGIIHKSTIPGRHQQMLPIDARIAILSKYLNLAMLSDELEKKEINREWTKKLQTLITVMNNKKYLKPEFNPDKIDDFGQIITTYNKKKTDHEDLIPLKTEVRVKMNTPKNPLTNEKYATDKFRKGDIRYSQDIHKVIGYVLNPMQPVMYKLSGINNARFIKQELLITK